MAENVPPGGAAAKNGAATDQARGLPYYEKLRRDLRDTIQKKRILDRNMAALEEQIYMRESAYLEDTSAAGNIIKGFDNYIKSSTISSASAGLGTISGSAAGGGPGGGRRKAAISDMDRVFSRSSVGYSRDSDSPASAISTPNHHVATPTGSFTAGSERTATVGGVGPVASSASGDKKKKKVAVNEDSEADSRANKRQKITYERKKGHEEKG